MSRPTRSAGTFMGGDIGELIAMATRTEARA
jgi:hypothetical protein